MHIVLQVAFILFCCLLPPFWKSTLLNQIPLIDYLMYSLYNQHDTTKGREETERTRGHKREKRRQKQGRHQPV